MKNHGLHLGRRLSSLDAADRIQSFLTDEVAAMLHRSSADIDPQQPFTYYGLDSAQTVELSGELEEKLDMDLPPTLLWDYPTIQAISDFLAQAYVSENDERQSLQETGRQKDPIAIVGVGCRFPGSEGPQGFWDTLCGERDAITEVPSERWDVDRYYHSDARTPGKMNTRWGGFLEDPAYFDASFFGIAPREAEKMDPQQRLLLETSWEAMEDAGMVPQRMAGDAVGVFAGISHSDYAKKLLDDVERSDAYIGTGSALSIAANRISYVFGFRGPSLAIDTACSSSLVSVYHACQSIWNEECHTALAGGVNLILSPEMTVNFSQTGFLSPDGRCKTFDADADGYVRGEGAGMIVLKPLSQAEKDHDAIYAVIRGGAVNNDGRSNGLMAPNGGAQEDLLREAYRRAEVSLGKIQYVEAHGTGTLLGDPIEVQALGNVLQAERTPDQDCAIGSVKSNIGHLESAAGIASLIKVALMLKHREMPASLHVKNLNPHIPFEQLPVRVQQTHTPWPETSGPARAGVSSFGFGGTNAHLVLEQAPERESEAYEEDDPVPEKPHVLVLSARNSPALQSYAQKYRDYIEGSSPSLRDICYSASVRKSHHDVRLALTGKTKTDVVEGLESFLENSASSMYFTGQKAKKRRKSAFVFSPYMKPACWWPDLRTLYEQEPTFRNVLEEWDAVILKQTGFSIVNHLTSDADEVPEVNGFAPSAYLAMQNGLLTLWKSWGIHPEAVAGFGTGEWAAARASGALSIQDVVCTMFQRYQALSAQPEPMLLFQLQLPEEKAKDLVDGRDDVDLAFVCSPTTVWVTCRESRETEWTRELREREVSFQRVDDVDPGWGFPTVFDERGSADEQAWEQETARIFHLDRTEERPQTLKTPWRFAVHWKDTIERLEEEAYDVFLEVGAHPISSLFTKACLRTEEEKVCVSSQADHPLYESMLQVLSQLYTCGCEVDWAALYPEESRFVRLPTYPWQRKFYWIDERPQDEPVSQRTETEEELATERPGSKITSYYKSLAESKAPQDEFLSFAPFLDIEPGFSWILTLREPQHHPVHYQKVLKAKENMQQVLYRYADLSSVRRVVDIGCGYATDLIRLGERNPHMELHGCNISPDQIQVGQKRIADQALQKNIRLFHRNVVHDPLPGRYDMALSVQVIHHLEDKAKSFSNIANHLNPGSLFVMAEIISNTHESIEHPQSSAFFIPKKEWADALAQNHLHLLQCVDVSREIGNFLYDPDFYEHLDQVSRGQDENVREHLEGPHLLGELLRREVVLYTFLTVQKSPHLSKEVLREMNLQRLEAPLPYSNVQEEPDHAEYDRRVEIAQEQTAAGLSETVAFDPAQDLERLETYLGDQVTHVLELDASEMTWDQPLDEMGLDSIMALDLKQKVEKELDVELPVADLLEGPSVRQLAEKISSLATSGSEQASETASFQQTMRLEDIARKADSPEELMASIGHLSDEEVEQILELYQVLKEES